MKSQNIRIIRLFSFLISCLLLSLTTMAEAELLYQLVNRHEVAETSNRADVDLLFDQTGIQEEFRLELYNSNPDSPVLVIHLTESEEFYNPLPSATVADKNPRILVSVSKKMFFYPAVLSGQKTTPPLEFHFVNSPEYTQEQKGDEVHEQPSVRYRVSATWNSDSLILTFQQNWEKPQEMDITEWVRKRGVTLAHTPKISRIDVLAKHNSDHALVESDYQLGKSLGLNFPIWQQLFGEARKVVDTPEIFHPPSRSSIESVIVSTCKKIAEERAYLFYLLTPSIELATPEDARKIASAIRWRKTSPEQDAIYNDVIKCSRQLVHARERVIKIDDKLDTVVLPRVSKALDRYIYLRPKNSSLNKYWVITSKMFWGVKVANVICEHDNGAKNCLSFPATPVNLASRLVFLTRNQSGEVKAWLGSDKYEQIVLNEKFPDISQVEEFDISEEFREVY